jgi:glycosyltransferase involved in cell wall biosynthesis
VFLKIKKRLSVYNKTIKKLITRKTLSTIKIGFICGNHGRNGATVAIASIANGLSRKFDVSFEVPSTSSYNKLLDSSVKLKKNIEEDKDIYIFDLRADINEVRKKKLANKKVILSIHGLSPPANRLSEKHLSELLFLADKVHFVGRVQQGSFHLHENDFFIIPNSVNPVDKCKITNNIGVVGDLDKPNKNVDLSIEIGLKSRCDNIHIWSTNRVLSADDRVVHHKWEGNRSIIYNSFDVLVFLSKRETFGLVIAEALSAGIPCVLSDIEAFLPFRECPGVLIIKNDEIDTAHQHIDHLLTEKDNLRQPIIAYYQKHFTSDKMNSLWHSKILELVENL